MNPEQLALYHQHPSHGVDLVDDNPLINEQVKQISYQHHELINGSGFPSGITGLKIYPLAKIVAFADFLANRVVASGKPPFDAMREIIEERKDIFNYDPDVIKAFIKGMISDKK